MDSGIHGYRPQRIHISSLSVRLKVLARVCVCFNLSQDPQFHRLHASRAQWPCGGGETHCDRSTLLALHVTSLHKYIPLEPDRMTG